MDLFKNVERVKNMLIGTCGCTYEEAIIVCEKAKELFQYQLKKQEAQDTYEAQLKEVIERNDKQSGYKITRFKKPVIPVEERKVYQRVCRRCDILYRTISKYSWFCDKCKLNSVSNQVHEKGKNKK